MDDIRLVHVIEGMQNLVNDLSSHKFTELPPHPDDRIIQLPTLDQLRHYVVSLLILQQLKYPHYIRVRLSSYYLEENTLQSPRELSARFA